MVTRRSRPKLLALALLFTITLGPFLITRAIASGSPAPQPPETHAADSTIAPIGTEAFVIPQATYQAVTISPVLSENAEPGRTLLFLIRSKDAQGVVSDFTIITRLGQSSTLMFPLGWRPSTDCLLLAPAGTSFAAWGVTGEPGPTARPGALLPFEPLARDPNRDARDRARERDFEAFLRERTRNR